MYNDSSLQPVYAHGRRGGARQLVSCWAGGGKYTYDVTAPCGLPGVRGPVQGGELGRRHPPTMAMDQCTLTVPS
jgi:hypothetical protein